VLEAGLTFSSLGRWGCLYKKASLTHTMGRSSFSLPASPSFHVLSPLGYRIHTEHLRSTTYS
jgi:hypothetical protein